MEKSIKAERGLPAAELSLRTQCLAANCKAERKKAGLNFAAVATFVIVALDVPYINFLFSNIEYVQVAAIAIVSLYQLSYFVYHKVKINVTHALLSASAASSLLTTLWMNGSLAAFVAEIAPIINLSALVIMCGNRAELQGVLKIWIAMLFALLAIDLISMVLYPRGLYASDYYTRNWFLGYKTNRLAYTLPLLALYTYYTLHKRSAIDAKFYCLATLVTLDAVMSQGTSSVIAVVFYSLIIVIVFCSLQRLGGLFRILSNAIARVLKQQNLLLMLYMISFLLIVVVQVVNVSDNQLLQNFDKEDSFLARTSIWSNVVAAMDGNWIFGLGVQGSSGYEMLTGGFLNAHCMMLTYLVSGGILATSIMLYSLARVIGISCSRSNDGLALVLCIYIIFAIGITSSALAFCPFLFCMISILSRTEND